MAKVKLLKDVWEKYEDGKPAALKVAHSLRSGAVPFVKDAVIEMSEASAAKYVERGLGEIVTDGKPLEEKPPS